MEIYGIDISLIISVVALISSILVPIYLNKNSLNVPIQRESIKKFLKLIDNEIDKHNQMFYKEDNSYTVDYIVYYKSEESPNKAILEFIELLNNFKETSDYQLLNKKHKKEINKLINKWSNYDSNDVNSPEVYVSKMEGIKRKFLNFL